MNFLCITSLNISYKNQSLLLSLGGCLEEKKTQISADNKQICADLPISFRKKF